MIVALPFVERHVSDAEEIKKFAELKEAGLLTVDEFEHVKRKIIGIEDDELAGAKSVEFYAASINAWLNYGQETSKQILAFSSAGLALLIAILVQQEFVVVAEKRWMIYGCLTSFVLGIFIVLAEFKRNRVYIKRMLLSEDHSDHDFALIFFDWAGVLSFVSGVFFLVIYVSSSLR